MTETEAKEKLGRGGSYGYIARCELDDCNSPAIHIVHPYPAMPMSSSAEYFEAFITEPKVILCDLHYKAYFWNDVEAEAQLTLNDVQRQYEVSLDDGLPCF